MLLPLPLTQQSNTSQLKAMPTPFDTALEDSVDVGLEEGVGFICVVYVIRKGNVEPDVIIWSKGKVGLFVI